jgi:hypothetical protein
MIKNPRFLMRANTFCGGFKYNPTTSVSFSKNFASRDKLIAKLGLFSPWTALYNRHRAGGPQMDEKQHADLTKSLDRLVL